MHKTSPEGKQPHKYLLHLVNSIFLEEEWAKCCYQSAPCNNDKLQESTKQECLGLPSHAAVDLQQIEPEERGKRNEQMFQQYQQREHSSQTNVMLTVGTVQTQDQHTEQHSIVLEMDMINNEQTSIECNQQKSYQ